MLPLSSSVRRNVCFSILRQRDVRRYLSTAPSSPDFSSPDCNIPPHIQRLIGRNLHLQRHHPLHILHEAMVDYFNNHRNAAPFAVFSDLSPLVSTRACFDQLRIAPDHPSRSSSDTYYADPQTVLRPHTSAHQVALLQQGYQQFLVAGDVYRRDEIDTSHYPVFHQMEGVQLWTDDERPKRIEQDLKHTLEGLMQHLFRQSPRYADQEVKLRWRNDYFPFTDPSFELDIWRDDGEGWMEILGCGLVHPDILSQAQLPDTVSGWAFGVGLERLAMLLFGIPDIRLFWSTDARFLQQFEQSDDGGFVTFTPYSKYPPCFKDIAFWILDREAYHSNDFYDVVRQVAGEWIEAVQLVDVFEKAHKTSHCYRITFRSMDRSLTNQEIDVLQSQIRRRVEQQLKVVLR
jgi:phenylalanyl-tRNA synthetase alpha chain